MRIPCLFFLLHLLILSACSPAGPSHPPYEGAEALATFELAEGFQIELFAAEPLVADPVAMEIDEQGRVWVVEMHGYPLDTSGSGVIKLLEDSDGDGWPDAARVFADGLTLPTGIMAWKDGILVTDAPDVLYLADTDGDGRADLREVMLTGFARSNPQHNLNTPRYELDNWIYLAHEGTVGTKFYHEEFGDEGSEVYYPAHPEGPRLPRNAAGRSVRIQPRTQGLEMLSGETQFGFSFDPWGHIINGSNYYYLFHEVLAARYLQRNPALRVDDPTQNMPAAGAGTTVYPITRNPQHQLLTDAGVITSGCGVTWYKGGLFPEPYDRVTFVAEPVHNLVHTDIIEDAGATFAAYPQFSGREFLASTDSWFRPVNFFTGPDGALYVIDYYRQIIEHPEWMSEEINQSGALYNGDGMGRIYRISPRGTAAPSFMDHLDLRGADAEVLVGHLSSPNIWWRRQAQRQLVEGQMKEAIPFLRAAWSTSHSPAGRVHILWALQGLDALGVEDLGKALEDTSAGVRENAVRLVEILPEAWDALLARLWAMADDGDAKVRFQVLCTLGDFADPDSRVARESILLRDLDDPWVHRAALSSPTAHEIDLERLIDAAAGQPALLSFLETYAGLIGRRQSYMEVNALLRRAARMEGRQARQAAAILDGLGKNLAGRESLIGPAAQQRLENLFTEGTDADLRRAALQFLRRSGYFDEPRPKLAKQAEAYAFDPKQALALRQDGAHVLAWAQPDAGRQLLSLIDPEEPVELQLAAVEALRQSADAALCREMLHRWQGLTPQVRSQAVNLFMGSAETRLMLLDAVEQKQVKQEQIGWRRSVWLLNADEEAVRARARAVLEGNQSGGEELNAEYEAILSLLGRAERGMAVFEKACATCHQLNGQDGLPLGPDLAAVRNRPPQAILRDILEPNASIADGYEMWVASLSDSSRVSGIMASESAEAITLRSLSGEEVRIERRAIRSMEAQPYSAMPEGLASQLTDQEMADLLAMLSGRLQ